MPGIFDFIGSLLGGGGGSGGGDPFASVDPSPFSLDPGAFSGDGNPFGSDPFGLSPPSTLDTVNLFGGGNPASLFGGDGGLGTGTPVGSIDPGIFNVPFTPQGGLGTGTPVDTIDPSIFNVPFTPSGGLPGATGPVTNPGVDPANFKLPPGLLGGGSGGGGPATGGGTPTAPGAAKPGNPISSILSPGGLIPGMTLPQILASLGLAGTALSGPGTPPGLDQLQASTKSNDDLLRNQVLPTALANQQGNISGTALNQFERSLQQKQAAIRQAYAGTGESGSTMEAQDLAGARDATDAAIFTAAQQMASSGLNFATSLIGADNTAFNDIMQAQIAQDKEFQDAMAAFAAAAAGTTQQAANATTTANG